jgi:hypothetical protein
MDGNGEYHVKWSKPNSKKAKVVCFLSYVETRTVSQIYMRNMYDHIYIYIHIHIYIYIYIHICMHSNRENKIVLVGLFEGFTGGMREKKY